MVFLLRLLIIECENVGRHESASRFPCVPEEALEHLLHYRSPGGACRVWAGKGPPTIADVVLYICWGREGGHLSHHGQHGRWTAECWRGDRRSVFSPKKLGRVRSPAVYIYDVKGLTVRRLLTIRWHRATLNKCEKIFWHILVFILRKRTPARPVQGRGREGYGELGSATPEIWSTYTLGRRALLQV